MRPKCLKCVILCLESLFSLVEFGEINVRNTASENTREVDTKPPKILVECNAYLAFLELQKLLGGIYLSEQIFYRKRSMGALENRG